jgi:hypothetical protein
MMRERSITAHGQCERSRRSEGFPAQRSCVSCHLGPCRLGIGEPESSSEPPQWFKDVWDKYEAEKSIAVPNRLFGAAINERGEAV